YFSTASTTRPSLLITDCGLGSARVSRAGVGARQRQLLGNACSINNIIEFAKSQGKFANPRGSAKHARRARYPDALIRAACSVRTIYLRQDRDGVLQLNRSVAGDGAAQCLK